MSYTGFFLIRSPSLFTGFLAQLLQVLSPVWMELTLQGEVGDEIFPVILDNVAHHSGWDFKLTVSGVQVVDLKETITEIQVISVQFYLYH